MRRPAFLLCLFLTGLQLPAGTKLSKAALSGDLLKVKACVQAGEKVNDYDKWTWTPLHWAAYYGYTEIALWLLEQGADPNVLTYRPYGRFNAGVTPLIFASYYGHASMVEGLLKAKADPSTKDAQGQTALDYAKSFGFEDCVKLLEPASAATASPATK